MSNLKYPINITNEAGPNTDQKLKDLVDAVNYLQSLIVTLQSTVTSMQTQITTMEAEIAALQP